ncbi:hypothetical protein HYX11_02610 [Candidatus Woesearchaeota archaeon]|nr:hypothetical protein [Candidatus Woesearchaeota archaeon]
MKIKYAVIIILGLILLVSCSPPNNIDQTTQPIPTTVTNNPPPTLENENGCPSKYDGTWKGLFTYEYDVPIKDANGWSTGEYKKITKSLHLTITLKCVSDDDTTTVLSITHAINSHPHFGCQISGCTPDQNFGTINLPSKDTDIGKESLEGQFIPIKFPNGINLGSTDGFDALYVGVDGTVLSNTLNPAYTCRTWGAGGTTEENALFPSKDETAEFLYPACFKSWSMNKVS